MRRVCIHLVIAGSALGIAGVLAAPEVSISQKGRVFTPAQLSVVRGTILRFVNDESIVHHAYVSAADFSADSGDIAPGQTAALLFDKEGRFLVRCAIHPRMRLEVEVTQ